MNERVCGCESAVHRCGENLPSIDDVTQGVSDCPTCEGDGWVCETHPDRQWPDGDPDCDGPGMPCICTEAGMAEAVSGLRR